MNGDLNGGPADPARVREAFEGGQGSSLLDLVDNLLNQGVVVVGEVVLGLAGVDLIYLRLSALLCAADRVFPPDPPDSPPEPPSASGGDAGE